MRSPDPGPQEGDRCVCPVIVRSGQWLKADPPTSYSNGRITSRSPPSDVLSALGSLEEGLAVVLREPCLDAMGSPDLGTDTGGRIKIRASRCLPREDRLSAEDLC